MYDKGRQAFAEGLSWATGTFKVVGVAAAYVPNLSTDSFLADIPTGPTNRIFTTAALSAKSEPAGVLDAADLTQAAVGGAVDCQAIVIFHDTGVEATSELIAYIDTGTNLPFSPNAGDVQIQWDNGLNKILKL